MSKICSPRRSTVGSSRVTLESVDGRGRRRFGSLTIDFDAKEVLLDGVAVSLTPAEFTLLAALALRPRQAVKSRDLLSYMWGGEWRADTTPLQVHISRLRAKLGESGASPSRIVSVRGYGYRFEPGIDNARTVELLIGADFLLRSVTPAEPFLGYVPEDIIGTYFSPLGLDQQQLQAVISGLLASGTMHLDGQALLRTGDGDQSMMRVASDVLLTPEGAFDGFRSTIYLPE